MRYDWHTKGCTYSTCTTSRIQRQVYICETIITIIAINILTSSRSLLQMSLFVFLCVIRAFNILSTLLANVSIQYNTVNYMHYAVQQISRAYSSYTTESLNPFTNASPFPLPLAPDNHGSTLCFYKFNNLRFLILHGVICIEFVLLYLAYFTWFQWLKTKRGKLDKKRWLI